jgi:tRNA (Thr-GGU) A37 N-methylase
MDWRESTDTRIFSCWLTLTRADRHFEGKAQRAAKARLYGKNFLSVFALDSPTRPNPIGLTLVHLIKRQGNRLFVQGLDFFDGTPILDIKGYGPQYRTDKYTMPNWFRALADEKGYVQDISDGRFRRTAKFQFHFPQ